MTSFLVVRTNQPRRTFDVQPLEPRLCLTAVAATAIEQGLDALGPGPRFSGPIISPTPAAVQVMIAGDFTGDGKPDVLVRSSPDSSLHLYPGSGTGKFGPAGPAINAGINPSAMVSADFNKDGKLDVAVANNPGQFATVISSVTILLGNGDGTFKTAAAPFGGQQPVALAVADFNNDGAPDLVVANRGQWNVPGTLGPASTGAGVLLGNGDGMFKIVQKIALFEQFAVGVGDFNGDGNPDAVFGNNNPLVLTAFPVAQLTVASGDGAGGFTTRVVAGFPGRPGGVVVADLNGDKLDDVAALGLSPGITGATTPTANKSTVQTFISHSDGSVTPGSTVNAVVTDGQGLSAADFNGDGRLDFAVAGNDPRLAATLVQPGAVSVMFGVGDGMLSPPTLWRTGPGPKAQAVADVNGDGRADLLTGGAGGISTLLNQGQPLALIVDSYDSLDQSSPL